MASNNDNIINNGHVHGNGGGGLSMTSERHGTDDALLGNAALLAVARDLLLALQEFDADKEADVYLEASDGSLVPACRFVLAARSGVLKRMLYGPFREARQRTIGLRSYAADVLMAIVHYCNTNSIPETFASSSSVVDTAREVRQLVQLARAADFLGLPGLERQAERRTVTAMVRHPALSCAVFDEVSAGTALSEHAMHIIECRPYVALDDALCAAATAPDRCDNDREPRRASTTGEGGIECLRADRLLEVVKNPYLNAGELFLFRMLHRWYETATAVEGREAALDAARGCCKHILFENIEPASLLTKVQKCPFVPRDAVFEAVAKQALRASQNGVWMLRSRGRCGRQERVLVEGAGSRDCNGMYYRLSGLKSAQGSLVYSKREVAAGQPYVYTLSVAVRDDATECRIFCSPLLTHDAVETLQSMHSCTVVDPVFQPVLQVVAIDPGCSPDGNVPTGRASGNPSATASGISSLSFSGDCGDDSLFVGTAPLPLRKYGRVRPSDGNRHLAGTLACRLHPLVESGEVTENSVVKVLEFGLYLLDGVTAVHVSQLSVVHAGTTGQRFGNPRPLLAASPASGENDPLRPGHAGTAPGDATTTTIAGGGGLRNLYSCKIPGHPGDAPARVPRTGWQADDCGLLPSPVCTLLPAVPKGHSCGGGGGGSTHHASVATTQPPSEAVALSSCSSSLSVKTSPAVIAASHIHGGGSSSSGTGSSSRSGSISSSERL